MIRSDQVATVCCHCSLLASSRLCQLSCCTSTGVSLPAVDRRCAAAQLNRLKHSDCCVPEHSMCRGTSQQTLVLRNTASAVRDAVKETFFVYVTCCNISKYCSCPKCMYVCMYYYVCMCMYVCMYLCMYVCMRFAYHIKQRLFSWKKLTGIFFFFFLNLNPGCFFLDLNCIFL